MSAYPPEWTFSLETQAAIDTAVKLRQLEVQELQRRIRLLWSRRNLLSLTGRLPPEVLGDIFLALVEDWVRYHYGNGGHAKSVEKSWEWLQITRVCHHWRGVALHTPHLWKYIPINGWNSAAMRRTWLSFDYSGNVPLTILWNRWRDTSPSKKLSRGLVQNMYRTQSLAACLDTQFFRHAEAYGTLDAPLLECFSGEVDTFWSEAAVDFKVVRTALWPRLRMLEGDGVPYAFVEAAVRPTLTILKVRNATELSSVETWVELLRELPLLEHLELRDVLSESRLSQAALSAKPVVLRSLKILSLVESEADAAHARLINHLAIPGDARIRFSEDHSCSLETAQYVFESLGSKTRGQLIHPMLTQPATHTIDLRLRTYAEVSIDIYTEPDVFICQSLSEPWKVSDGVSPATTVALRGWNVVIPALCTHYPLAELRVLRLTSKDPMHGAIDWTALSQLPSIREMEIEDSHWSAVAELSDCLGAPHSFPALETLVFNGIRWYRTHGLSFGTIQAHKDAIFPLLVAALAKRRTQGSPLKRLAILSARNLSDPWAGYREALEELEQQVEELVVHPHNLDDSDGATSSEIESDESADL